MKRLLFIILMLTWVSGCMAQDERPKVQAKTVATEYIRGLKSTEFGGTGILHIPYNWGPSGNYRIHIGGTTGDTALHEWIYERIAEQINTGDFVGLDADTYSITGTGTWNLDNPTSGDMVFSTDGADLILRKTNSSSGDIEITNQRTDGSININNSGTRNDSTAVNENRLTTYVGNAIDTALFNSDSTDYWKADHQTDVIDPVINITGDSVGYIGNKPVTTDRSTFSLATELITRQFVLDAIDTLGSGVDEGDFWSRATNFSLPGDLVVTNSDGILRFNGNRNFEIIRSGSGLISLSSSNYIDINPSDSTHHRGDAPFTTDRSSFSLATEFITRQFVLDAIDTLSSGGGGDVTSVFGRTGDVVAQSGDYEVSQVTNAMGINSGNSVTTAFTISNAGTRWETGSGRTGIYSPTSGSNRYGWLMHDDRMLLYNQNGLGNDIEIRFSYLDGNVLDAGFLSVDQTTEDFSFFDSSGSTLTNVKVADPVSDSDAVTKRHLDSYNPSQKIDTVYEIGDWDMDTDPNNFLNISGDGPANGTIIDIRVSIRGDGTTYTSPLGTSASGSTATEISGSVRYNHSTENIEMRRTNSGYFDDTNYNATSFNRGWIIVTYFE